MPITQQQKKQFQTIGHHLSPVVIIAKNGLSEGVISELERALNDHELIKIKLDLADPTERKLLASEISKLTQCEVVQSIGKIALVYKKAEKPNRKLSNIIRHQGNF